MVCNPAKPCHWLGQILLGDCPKLLKYFAGFLITELYLGPRIYLEKLRILFMIYHSSPQALRRQREGLFSHGTERSGSLIKVPGQGEATGREPKFLQSGQDSKQRQWVSQQREGPLPKPERRWQLAAAFSQNRTEEPWSSSQEESSSATLASLLPDRPAVPTQRGNAHGYYSKHISISRSLSFQSTTFIELKILFCVSQQPLCKWVEESCACQAALPCALPPKASWEGQLTTEAFNGQLSPFGGGSLIFFLFHSFSLKKKPTMALCVYSSF